MEIELSNLSWPEVKERSKDNPVVVIPTGATEQHGPHLPLKVDIATADYIAREVCRRNGMLVTPPLNFGYSEMWHSYPGTISFSQRTFMAAVGDIFASLIEGGFRKLFVLNGHNGNLPLLQSIAHEVALTYEEKDIQIGIATYIYVAREECEKIGEYFRDGTHANEAETSMSLALFPECVDMDKAKEVSEGYVLRKAVNYDSDIMIINNWSNSDQYNGVYGNPSLATPEKGKAYLEALIDKIADKLLKFDKGLYNPIGKDGIPRSFS